MKPSTSTKTTLHLRSTTSNFISSMEDCSTLHGDVTVGGGGGEEEEGMGRREEGNYYKGN